MEKSQVIIITGAAGFIGSYLVGFLNRQGYENLILVDEFEDDAKQINLIDKKYSAKVERADFFDWFGKQNISPAAMFHLGARNRHHGI